MADFRLASQAHYIASTSFFEPLPGLGSSRLQALAEAWRDVQILCFRGSANLRAYARNGSRFSHDRCRPEIMGVPSLKGENAMTILTRTLAAVAAGTVLATSAFAQSAAEVRGPTPYFPVENEPAPKLIVDPALPGPLALGLVQIQYRVENVRILPVFGAAALNVSPRLGHLHITVDDLPWLWADASDLNTVDIAGLPPGPHKVKIELVDPNHNVFPGQAATVTFTVPAKTK